MLSKAFRCIPKTLGNITFDPSIQSKNKIHEAHVSCHLMQIPNKNHLKLTL